MTTSAIERPVAAPIAPARPLLGALVCAVSAAGFGANGIFGKLAYDAGVSVLTLLTVRFWLAALILGAIHARRRGGELRGRRLATALALGAIGYATQSALFFTAVTRMDVSLVALLLYIYPALVTLAAVALGRDRLDVVRVVSLALAFVGLALVLFVGDGAHVDALGVALAIGAALVYTGYLLTSESLLSGIDPLGLARVVCAGAAATFTVVALAAGKLSFHFDAIGWLWLGGIALVSTVLAIVLLFAGIRLIGPSRASIISTVEPLVTVVLAFVVFGEALSAAQLIGGAIVLGSVVLLQAHDRLRPWPSGSSSSTLRARTSRRR